MMYDSLPPILLKSQNSSAGSTYTDSLTALQQDTEDKKGAANIIKETEKEWVEMEEKQKRGNQRRRKLAWSGQRVKCC